jgi:C1A family cysteine protease
MITADNSIVFKRFIEFTHKFNKVYSSMEEFTRKFEIFKNNLIEVLAADEFSGEHTKGITKFSDLTKEEFHAQYLTLKVTPNSWCHPASKFLAATPVNDIDWRTKGGVSPVKDQGQCGSCWAFSTIAFLESQSLIKNQKAVTYSEQQLVDCDHNGDQGCNGGLMQTAFQYIQTAGIEADSAYPYRARDQTCAYKKASVIATVTDVHCYENVSNAQMQTYLTTIGPLSIAVDADAFQMYDSGVLDCTGSQLDHGVLLVGFTADTWIIKNSWGKNWGEAGFVRVKNTKGHNCAVGAYIATATLN